MDTCGALNSKSPLLGSGTNAILFDPWIFSAMAMAMSIYRTLCVLVSFSVPSFLFFFPLKISILEMFITFGNGLPLTFNNLMVTTYDPPLTSN